MKILTNGSCLVRGALEGGWPDILQEKFNHDVTNLSLYGAGHDYVLKTTSDYLLQNKFDLVIIMLPYFYKVDIQVPDPENYSNIYYTSRSGITRLTALYKARQYARAKKRNVNYKNISYLPLDTGIFQDNWVFVKQMYNSKISLPENYINLFENYLTSTYAEIKQQNLSKVLKLQEMLKQKNQPYLFCFGSRPTGLCRFSDQYNLLDWNNVLEGVYLKQLALAMNSYNKKQDGANYPAHEVFADLLINRIQKMS